MKTNTAPAAAEGGQIGGKEKKVEKNPTQVPGTPGIVNKADFNFQILNSVLNNILHIL